MSQTKASIEMDLFADYDEGNLIIGAVANSIEENQKGDVTSKKSNKIEDFGEKLGGARKDLYATYCEMIKTAKEDEIEKVPLSKSFPAPNYEKLLELGIESWKVDAIRALRDTVPPKPKQYSWAMKVWITEMSTLRDMSISVLENKWTEEEFRTEIAKIQKSTSEYDFDWKNKKFGEKIEDYMLIYQKLGHRKSCSSLTFLGTRNGDEHSISLCEMKGERYIHKFLSQGETKSEALNEFLYSDEYYRKYSDEKKPQNKQSQIKVYNVGCGKYYAIGSKVGKEYMELKSPFETSSEAFNYLKENMAELEEKLEKYREIPNEREGQNAPRIGKNPRTEDVTPEEFQEKFGFRGVEFGNWVENKTRQEDLNQAYDALMDMSEVLNLPPRALSLNGKLGLAFGARGKGGKNPPLAHYESAKVVINLTKKKGAGNLGHGATCSVMKSYCVALMR